MSEKTCILAEKQHFALERMGTEISRRKQRRKCANQNRLRLLTAAHLPTKEPVTRAPRVMAAFENCAHATETTARTYVRPAVGRQTYAQGNRATKGALYERKRALLARHSKRRTLNTDGTSSS